MTRGEEIIIQSYDYDKYLLDTGFSTEEAALKCMRVAFIDGARWADAHPRWISVDEELPKEKGWIILSTFFNSIACPAYYYEGEDVEELRSQGITHWMPMPSLPSCSEKPNNCEKGGEK